MTSASRADPSFRLRAISSAFAVSPSAAFSATFTSKPGIQVSGFGTPVNNGSLAANFVYNNQAVLPSLGRPLSGNATNITVNLLEPHERIGARVNELDLRIGKIIRIGRTRTHLGLDIYNLLNAAPPLSYNQAFIVGGSWLTPTSVLSARFAKISAQFNF